MARVLSALVLLPIVVGIVWFLPPVATLGLACVAAVLAFVEYAAILDALEIRIVRTIGGIAVVSVDSAGLVVPLNVGATAVSTAVVLDGVNFRHS